jgi:hypothetical protein
MVALLGQIRAKSQDLQLSNIVTRLQSASRQIDKNMELQIGRIAEWVKRTEEASPGFWSKLMSWTGRVAAVIGAVAGVVLTACAAVASGGAAAPMLIFSVTALVGAVVALADQVSQSCGGPRVNIGQALSGLSTHILELCGVDPHEARTLGRELAGGMALAFPVLLLLDPSLLGKAMGGVARLAGAGPSAIQYVEMGVGLIASVALGAVMVAVTFGMGAGAAAANVGASIHGISQIISTSSSISQAGAAFAEGATTIRGASVQKLGDDAMAARRELQGDAAALQHGMRMDRDTAAKIYQQVASGTKNLSRLISQMADNQMLILGNLSGPRSA